MSDLSGVTNQNIRSALGDRCFNAGHCVIHGSNTENALTTVAIEHCADGVFQTDFAIDSEIDISALTVLSAKDGETIATGTKTHAAKASGDDDEVLVYILACKGNVAYVVEPYINVAAAQDDAEYELMCPPGYAPFAVIHLTRTAADTATFQLGNNTAAQGDLDATGRTAVFYDISVLPATIAELVAAV